jgi:hypothetical protein
MRVHLRKAYSPSEEPLCVAVGRPGEAFGEESLRSKGSHRNTGVPRGLRIAKIAD